MKLFKYTIAAAAVAMTLGLSSCDENGWLPGAEGKGVYFSTEQSSAVQLTTNSTEFPVEVGRSGITEAGTYGLVSTVTVNGAAVAPEANPFTLPTAAEFEAEQTAASLKVAVDMTKFEAGATYTVSFAFAEGTPTTQYGDATKTFTVTRGASWSKWEKYGDGLITWHYDIGFIFQGDDPDLPLSIRHNLDNPDEHQFLIEHWGKDTPLIIDWNSKTNVCHITPQYTGYSEGEGAKQLDLYIATIESQYFGHQGVTADWDDKSVFDPATGEFELNVGYILNEEGKWNLLNNGYGYETATCGEYADYSIQMVYNGFLTNAEGDVAANLTYTTGAAAQGVKLAASSTLGAQALLDAIISGSAESVVDGKAGSDVTVNVPVAGSGDYVCVAVTYKGSEPQSAVAVKFSVTGGGGSGQAEWKTVCQAEFIDGWITPMWKWKDKNGNPISYTQMGWLVEAQESTTTPGVYRLKNCYLSEDCAINYVDENKNTSPASIIIDASNPNNVIINPQYSGVTLGFNAVTGANANTDYFIANEAGTAMTYDGATADQIIAAGVNTKMEDGLVHVSTCLIGVEINEVKYALQQLKPYAEIFFDFAGGAAAKHKVAAAKARAKFSGARVKNLVKHNFQVAQLPLAKTKTIVKVKPVQAPLRVK